MIAKVKKKRVITKAPVRKGASRIIKPGDAEFDLAWLNKLEQFPGSPDFDEIPDLSCVDWEDRIRLNQSLMPDGLTLYQPLAAKARKFYGQLCLPDVPGKPLLSDVGGEWFNEIVEAVFGTFNGIQRSVNEFFFLVPKKSSKTTNSAGIMTIALAMNRRPRAELLLIAPSHEIANLAFSQAAGMIEANEGLKARCHVMEYKKTIEYITTRAQLKIKTFDPKIVTGTKAVAVLLDEIHVIAEYPQADRVLGQLRGGMVANPEAFLIMISTQSERVPSGIFRSELMKARKIRDGVVKNERTLPIIYEFPEDIVKTGQWRDPNLWHMVTPNKDLSITIDRLVEGYDKAINSGEEEMRRWASQHLNIEIGMALKSDSWSGAKLWEDTSADITLDKIIKESDAITVGIDGGGLDDMLGLCVCGRNKETRVWSTWIRAWIHEKAVERWKQNEQQYKDFSDAGDLVIVKDFGTDVAQLVDIVEQCDALLGDKSIGVDPAGIGSVLDELDARGIDVEKKVVGVSQGWRLSAAIKTTERKLAEGNMKHAPQGLSAWAASNARVEPRGNAVLITKSASGAAKIDPLMATFNAVELMSRNPAAPKKYEIHFL